MTHVKTPERTSAAAFARYAAGTALLDSASLHWEGLYVRRYRFPGVVDRFLVPATAEPLISCVISGSAEFQERDDRGTWIRSTIRQGHLFVTRSKTPYEVAHTSLAGEPLEVVQIHIGLDLYLAAVEEAFPGKSREVEIVDFSGYDAALQHLCWASADLLAARTAGKVRHVAHLAHLLASYLAERYVQPTTEKPEFHLGLSIWQLRKVQDYVQERLAEDIPVETLADLVHLSPFHFSRVFKQATGMTPLQYVTRTRITLAQQLIRETSRSFIEVGLEVGYVSPSHFAKVFRRVTGVTPTEFRSAL